MIRDRWVINNLPLRSILKRRSFRRIIWGSAISDTAFTTDLSTRLASYLYTFNHLLYTIYVYTIIFPDHGYLTSARAGTCAIPLVADARSLRIGPTSVGTVGEGPDKRATRLAARISTSKVSHSPRSLANDLPAHGTIVALAGSLAFCLVRYKFFPSRLVAMLILVPQGLAPVRCDPHHEVCRIRFSQDFRT